MNSTARAFAPEQEGSHRKTALAGARIVALMQFEADTSRTETPCSLLLNSAGLYENEIASLHPQGTI